jgi:hypothetical protein
MVAAGEAIAKLLPPNDDKSGFRQAVSEPSITAYCKAQLGRYAAREGVSNDPPSPPYAHVMPIPLDHGTSIRDIPPLAERLKRDLLRQYDYLVGRASAAPAHDLSHPEAMPPQPEPPPPAIRVDASMVAVEGLSAVRDALIANELAELLAKRREAAPISAEPIVEPEPADVIEPEEAPAEVTKPAVARRGLRGAAVSALGLGGEHDV